MDGSTALDSILNLAATFKGDDSGHLSPEEKEKLWSLQDELGTTREGAKFRRAFGKRKSTTSNSSSEDGSTVWNQLRSVCNVADWPNLFSPESLVENRGYAGETKLTLIANEADQFLGCYKRELSREVVKLLKGLMKLG